MQTVKRIKVALVLSILLIGLSGCQKEEGPAEKAGKQIDESTEELGEKVEEAGEAIQDAAQGDN